MNYVSAVYGAVMLVILADWFIRGRREYNGCKEAEMQLYSE